MNTPSLQNQVPNLSFLTRIRKNPGLTHPAFGDLARLDAVRMSRESPRPAVRFTEEDGMMIYLTVTGRCNAHCAGCINSAVTLGNDDPRNLLTTSRESEPERDAAIVVRLAEARPEQRITVCFYGGEPFMATEKMGRIRQILNHSAIGDRVRFMVNTNGELLDRQMDRYPDLMKAIWLYTVSIDGDETQHNRCRPGTHLNVIEANLKRLKAAADRPVLFWSTLREDQSLTACFQEFLKLYDTGEVHYFFWHWAESREPFDHFEDFAGRYGEELETLLDVYLDRLTKGELLPIIHLNELVIYLATGRERGHSACAVELARNFDIMGGQICACSDLPPEMSLGELDASGNLDITDRDLNPLVAYKDWLGCTRCGVHPYCGGRCPVQALAGDPRRTLQYCQLMRLHVGIVQQRMTRIETELARHGIDLQAVHDHSAYLTKYTDVVP